MKPVSIVFAGVCVALALGVGLPAQADLGGASGILIPFHGRLELDGVGQTSTQPYTFHFEIYDAAEAGNKCDTDYEATSKLYGGAFAVVIGPVDPVCVVGKEVYIEVSVKPDGATEFVEMTGRRRVFPALGAMTSGTGDFSSPGQVDAVSVSTSDSVTAGTSLASGTTLTVGTNAQVNGALSVTGNATVSSNATVTGNLTVNGTGGNVPHNCVVRTQSTGYQTACDPGEIAVGGGGRCLGLWRLTESLPWGGASNDTPAQAGQPATAWRAVCQVWGSAGTYAVPQLGVYAICCKK